ncbi:MAG: flagellar assembly peptidoglycan hydrolase FlgJ [Gammaproteobacteria bacterium]
MTANISSFNDFQGLAQLRHDASVPSQETAREAARQFEALFVQMMLKSMRDANAVLGESQDTTYQEMFDQQIAMEMTRGRGLGIADMMSRQLGIAPEQAAANAAASLGTSIPALLSRLPAARAGAVPAFGDLPVPGLTELPVSDAPQPDLSALGTVGSGERADFRPASREEFVREIWPLAVKAGRALGVEPRAIVAQAALETGWGSRLIRDDAGVSGNNLFGIKADSRWNGERVSVATLEYEDGLPKPQRASFRAYPDLAAGFEDYVRFLSDNPRYRDALRAGADAGAYADRLQSSGYATDPRYAEKIRSIIASPILGVADTSLKAGNELPKHL